MTLAKLRILLADWCREGYEKSPIKLQVNGCEPVDVSCVYKQDGVAEIIIHSGEQMKISPVDCIIKY